MACQKNILGIILSFSLHATVSLYASSVICMELNRVGMEERFAADTGSFREKKLSERGCVFFYALIRRIYMRERFVLYVILLRM